MVKFLLQRPIAVLMAFTACFIVGLVTYYTLPVSLLPDIAIPQITVQVSGENSSARELENTVVAPVRRQLLQVAGLREIKSETRDGAGIIRMEFDFGVNTDLAFIEVNEKIDAAMNSLPKEAERPKAIKASATDIPVLYLNMTLKKDRAFEQTDEQRFLTLCELAENVVKRRIEQLPEVAMADITGVPGRILQIVPDQEKMSITGLTIADLESALAANNVEPGSMLVRDGYYEYNIRIATLLRTPEDVENIHIRKGERLMQLKDLCKVAIVSQKEQGLSMAEGKRAVTLAIIKQSDENMDKALWTENGFKSKDVRKPDDRANALAVLSGLADRSQYHTILNVLKTTENSSPYMEYYVLEALCKMGEYELAKDRIKDRYESMIGKDYSTLWEFWDAWRGTKNHAWSGGPLVIMSKHFAGITPIEAGYEKVKIDPQYTLSDSLNCTVPSVKGLITLDYEKVNGEYNINLTLPQDMNAVLYVPADAVININSEVYYQNGEYVNSEIGNVEIVEK